MFWWRNFMKLNDMQFKNPDLPHTDAFNECQAL